MGPLQLVLLISCSTGVWTWAKAEHNSDENLADFSQPDAFGARPEDGQNTEFRDFKNEFEKRKSPMMRLGRSGFNDYIHSEKRKSPMMRLGRSENGHEEQKRKSPMMRLGRSGTDSELFHDEKRKSPMMRLGKRYFEDESNYYADENYPSFEKKKSPMMRLGRRDYESELNSRDLEKRMPQQMRLMG